MGPEDRSRGDAEYKIDRGFYARLERQRIACHVALGHGWEEDKLDHGITPCYIGMNVVGQRHVS